MGIKAEDLMKHFKEHESFTTSDIHDFFADQEPDIKRATVNWRIYDLVQKGVLKRIGRGIYTIGNKKNFIPVQHTGQQEISSLIKKEFPLINFCLWHSSLLNQFYHHIVAHDFMVVETERDVVDAVYYNLKDSYNNIFREPSRQVMEDFVFENSDSVIVKHLISEAPLQTVDLFQVPTIEKLLVDFLSDTNIFFFLQGMELVNVFKNVMESYTVNMDRLKRYARRRNREYEVKEIIGQAKEL